MTYKKDNQIFYNTAQTNKFANVKKKNTHTHTHTHTYKHSDHNFIWLSVGE